MNKIDKKLLSLMTIEERFKYIQKKRYMNLIKIQPKNKKIANEAFHNTPH